VWQSSWEVAEFDLPEHDIANGAVLKELLRERRYNLIINAAAYTDVEGAEAHEAEAFHANEFGARTLAEEAAARHIPLIYISTDFVFDGKADKPYEADDETNPLSVYGASKLAGEQATLEAHPQSFVVRTAWLYGPGGNNFVEKILKAADTRDELTIVEDEVGSPTQTWDLAEALLALGATDAFGVYHAVNSGQCSRLEFAKRFLELAGNDVKVSPCKSSDMPTKAERPKYSVLSTEKLEEACGYTMRPWDEALAHYMERREHVA